MLAHVIERDMCLEMGRIWWSRCKMGGLLHMWQHILKIVVIVLKLALQVILEVRVVMRVVLKAGLMAMHICLLGLHLPLLGLVVRGHDRCQALGQLGGKLKLLCADRWAGLVTVWCGVLLRILRLLAIVMLV